MRIAASIVGLVLLASCSMPTQVELANLSPDAIVVTSMSRDEGPITIAMRDSAELQGLDMSIRSFFSVALGGKVLRYEAARVPQDYIHTGFTGRKLKAQFGADRCIRLLRPEQDVFDPVPAPQPEGFPLCPLG